MGEEELRLLSGLIQRNYSGSQSELSMYLNLAMQTGAVLIGGIVLWRISARMHSKKKAQRERNSYFETPYSRGWRRK